MRIAPPLWSGRLERLDRSALPCTVAPVKDDTELDAPGFFQSSNSRGYLIAPLLHATGVGRSSGRRFCPAILTTILTLPGSTYNRTCDSSILGVVLSIFLFDIVVHLVINLVMLTTARAGNRRTGYCARSGTAGTST
ncbi:hypothetical protein FHW68_003536 [Pseudomonas sp. Tn43]|nr:hypothetical protein [Pseudomonas sp. Tn43]